MLLFPNAKINVGLDVLRKRIDGFHDLETLFYPLSLSDVLEINKSDEFSFTQTGIEIIGDIENNLVVKAFRVLQQKYDLPNVTIHLHKLIPFGAGLGGGSSDAAYTLKGLSQLFKLNLTNTELINIAAQLGSDCPFFIINEPVFAEGKGDQFSNSNLSLTDYFLLLIKPNVEVSTALAYANVVPKIQAIKLVAKLTKPVVDWKDHIENGFEKSVFPVFPDIESIKTKLYDLGAEYASMSGSGSSVFGLFKNDPHSLIHKFPECFCWDEKLLV